MCSLCMESLNVIFLSTSFPLNRVSALGSSSTDAASTVSLEKLFLLVFATARRLLANPPEGVLAPQMGACLSACLPACLRACLRACLCACLRACYDDDGQRDHLV